MRASAPRRWRSPAPRTAPNRARRTEPRRTSTHRSCLLDAQAVEQPLIAAPVAADADLQLEVDLATQLRFQRAAGGGADLAALPPPLADQDSLLRLGLGPDLGADRGQAVLARRHLLDLDLDRVRDLVAGPVEDLLAAELGHHPPARVVAVVLTRGEVGGRGGEIAAA